VLEDRRVPRSGAVDAGARPGNYLAVDIDQQSATIQLPGVATEVSRAPQSQMCCGRRSWMVPLYIRLLTGRFQVRILLAELTSSEPLSET
jgi:hypothetical protein